MLNTYVFFQGLVGICPQILTRLTATKLSVYKVQLFLNLVLFWTNSRSPVHTRFSKLHITASFLKSINTDSKTFSVEIRCRTLSGYLNFSYILGQYLRAKLIDILKGVQRNYFFCYPGTLSHEHLQVLFSTGRDD